MVLHQNEATKFRAKMTINSLWQRCQDGSSVRRDPALALVTGCANRDHQILHQKRLVALEARPRRDHRFDHPIFNADARGHLATAPPLLKRDRRRRLCAFVHATRLDIGTTPQAFQTGNLFAQPADRLFEDGNFTQNFNQQSLKLWTAQTRKREWLRRHMMKRIRHAESAQEKNAPMPTLLPLLPAVVVRY